MMLLAGYAGVTREEMLAQDTLNTTPSAADVAMMACDRDAEPSLFIFHQEPLRHRR